MRRGVGSERRSQLERAPGGFHAPRGRRRRPSRCSVEDRSGARATPEADAAQAATTEDTRPKTCRTPAPAPTADRPDAEETRPLGPSGQGRGTQDVGRDRRLPRHLESHVQARSPELARPPRLPPTPPPAAQQLHAEADAAALLVAVVGTDGAVAGRGCALVAPAPALAVAGAVPELPTSPESDEVATAGAGAVVAGTLPCSRNGSRRPRRSRGDRHLRTRGSRCRCRTRCGQLLSSLPELSRASLAGRDAVVVRRPLPLQSRRCRRSWPDPVSSRPPSPLRPWPELPLTVSFRPWEWPRSSPAPDREPCAFVGVAAAPRVVRRTNAAEGVREPRRVAAPRVRRSR